MLNFIINPVSSSGGSASIWEHIKTLIGDDVSYVVHYTRENYYADAVARDILASGQPETIIIIGGDGTLNSAINGIKATDKITLGYIPAGSGNDFARGMGIKVDDNYIRKVIAGNNVIKLDVGLLESNNNRSHFLVSAGIGCDADICTNNMEGKIKKLLNKVHLGSLSYTLTALVLMLTYKKQTIDVCVDDRHETISNCYFSTIMNGAYEGGGIRFCPDAVVTDGMLDICIVSRGNPISLFSLLPLSYSGKHVGKKGVSIYRGRKISFTLSDNKPAHTDGEYFDTTNSVTAYISHQIDFII